MSNQGQGQDCRHEFPVDTMTAPVCPIHNKAPILVFWCCRAANGGRATSPAKQASSRVNAQKARDARQRGREAPAIGGPDPAPDRPP